jgi:hypothetical protein
MRLTAALAVLCLLPAAALAEGEVYRWKDGSGIWHYSDQPFPGAELVKSARKPPGASQAAPATAANRPSTPAAPATTGQPVSDTVAQQVRAEAAAAQTEQCAKARENYDKTIQARRLYRVDDQGNQVFLNDAEIDQARLRARSDRDIACGSEQ